MKPLVVVLVQVALYGLLGSVEGKIKEGECEGENGAKRAPSFIQSSCKLSFYIAIPWL